MINYTVDYTTDLIQFLDYTYNDSPSLVWYETFTPAARMALLTRTPRRRPLSIHAIALINTQLLIRRFAFFVVTINAKRFPGIPKANVKTGNQYLKMDVAISIAW